MKLKHLLLVAVFTPALAAAADFSGTWKFDNTFNGKVSSVHCTLMQKDDALTGTCKPDIEGMAASRLTGTVKGPAAKWGYGPGIQRQAGARGFRRHAGSGWFAVGQPAAQWQWFADQGRAPAISGSKDRGHSLGRSCRPERGKDEERTACLVHGLHPVHRRDRRRSAGRNPDESVNRKHPVFISASTEIHRETGVA